MVSDASAITIEFIEEKRRSGIHLEGRVRLRSRDDSTGRRKRYGQAEHLRDSALLLRLVERAIDTLATEDGLLIGCQPGVWATHLPEMQADEVGADGRGDRYALRDVLGERAAAMVESLDPELGITLFVLTHEQFRQGGLPAWCADVGTLRVGPLLPKAVLSDSAAVPPRNDGDYLRAYAALTGRPGWKLSKGGYDAYPGLDIDLQAIGQLEAIVEAFTSDVGDHAQAPMRVELSLLADRTWRQQDTAMEIVPRLFLGLVLVIAAPFIWVLVLPILTVIIGLNWLLLRLKRRFH